MSGTGLPGVVAALSVLGFTYCLGGLHGLWLAWTQELRVRRWAGRLPELAQASCAVVLDAYDRGLAAEQEAAARKGKH